VRVKAPTGTLAALNSQPQEKRWVLHLLYYVPERRCEQFDVIEDVVPLYDVEVSVRTGAPPSSVTCVPGGGSLPFVVEGKRVRFTVPKIEGHLMVELSFN
jgi:hypothetical protein